MVRVHAELNDAHTDLYALRQKKLDELGLERPDQLTGTDIDEARARM